MKIVCVGISVALVVALSSSGCKAAKAGDPCTGKNVCTNASSALLCIAGSYVATPCSGADGCRASPFACDFRENAGGTACYEPNAPSAPMSCTSDKNARIRCSKGKVERDECDGPKKCVSKSETTASCDHTLKVGTPCSLEGDWCSNDGDWLQCRDSKLAIASKCRGPSHCKPFMDTVACDTTVGEDGDACFGKVETCSVDHKSVLTCASGHLKVETTCPAPKACDATGAPTCK